MPCQQCGGDTKKPTAKFCSVSCANEYKRGKGRKLDPTKRIRCKIDGYEFDDYLNAAGTLRKYSEKTLNKSFDWADWEIFDVEFNPAWRCPYCDWTTKDTAGGWVRSHLLNAHNKLPEEHCELYPDDHKLFPKYWKQYEMEKFKNESEDNRVECKICHKFFRGIMQSHLAKHGYTVEQYKNEFGDDTISSKVMSDKLRNSYYEHRPDLTPITDPIPAKELVRNIQNLKCGVCGKRCTSVGISGHVAKRHNMTIDEYVSIYGEFRVNKIKETVRLKDNNGKYACLICGEECVSDRGLKFHVKLKHDIDGIEYAKNYIFAGIPQLCDCGCGKEVGYLSYEPYRRRYVMGHNDVNPMAGKSHSDESKEMMRKSAIKRGFKGRGKRDTGIERVFEEFLIKSGTLYEKQYQTAFGLVDFYIPSLDILVEIDGSYWHPTQVKNLSSRLVNSCVSQKRKSRLSNLIRIRAEDVAKITTVDDIFKYNFVYDFTLSHRQVVCNKRYLETYDPVKKVVLVQNLVKLFREYSPEFPYPPKTDNLTEVIEKIQKFKHERIVNGVVFSNKTSNMGVPYLKSVFKSYWNSSFNGKKSPVEAWKDNDIMKTILSYRVGLNPKNETFDISLHQCLVGLSASRYTVSFFKPMLAASIYKHFLRNIDNPVVFDPCAGFGGRLLGFKSVYPSGTYIACEPNIETYNELIELSSNFTNIKLYNCKLEDFDLSLITDVDLSFTSIPYHDLEVYSNPTVYATYNTWVDEFIGTMKQLPNLLVNVPLNIRDEFGDCEEFFIESAASHFSKDGNTKREYLLWFGKSIQK